MDLLDEENVVPQQEQIEMLKRTHLYELTKALVIDESYGDYLIKTTILHSKVLDIIEFGITYFSEIENYEECAMLVTLKKEILKTKI